MTPIRVYWLKSIEPHLSLLNQQDFERQAFEGVLDGDLSSSGWMNHVKSHDQGPYRGLGRGMFGFQRVGGMRPFKADSLLTAGRGGGGVTVTDGSRSEDSEEGVPLFQEAASCRGSLGGSVYLSFSFCRPRYFQLLTVETGTPIDSAASW